MKLGENGGLCRRNKKGEESGIWQMELWLFRVDSHSKEFDGHGMKNQKVLIKKDLKI